ncbi:GPW/gp25 family protein [Acidovorax sp. NPDC077693]|jgi:phage baseplate assembly protein W|uniref:GPW/gp25 family protein n=1 Tax=unclassified Acidovorax TaxID=2684926 RepID=UPI0037C6D9C7
MNRTTGAAISGLEHLRQSVGDILSTPIGSRVMRREYGSLVPELIDHPDNNASQVRLFSAVASALLRWEPRFRLTRVGVQRDAERPGYALIELHGSYHEGRRPAPLSLQVSVTARNA